MRWDCGGPRICQLWSSYLKGLRKSLRTKGLTARVSSRPGAKAVLRRPRPAGTRQYILIAYKSFLKKIHIKFCDVHRNTHYVATFQICSNSAPISFGLTSTRYNKTNTWVKHDIGRQPTHLLCLLPDFSKKINLSNWKVQCGDF